MQVRKLGWKKIVQHCKRQSHTWQEGKLDEYGRKRPRWQVALNCSYLLSGTTLWRAAQLGDIGMVRYWLDFRGMSVDAPNPNGSGTTALHYAVSKCHLPVVKELLERGAVDQAAGQQRRLAHLSVTSTSR